jgi:hypothetical protein
LAGGDVEAIEEIGLGDVEDEAREGALVVVLLGFVPDFVWDIAVIS